MKISFKPNLNNQGKLGVGPIIDLQNLYQGLKDRVDTLDKIKRNKLSYKIKMFFKKIFRR